MRKSGKHLLSVLLALTILFGGMAVPFSGMALVASAATVTELNSTNVFLKQHTSVTCTLSSAAMLLRRTAYAAGYSDWEEITEENLSSSAWMDGVGLLWNFKYDGMTVGHGYFPGSDTKSYMIEMLSENPQGFVIYNGGNKGQSHAVFLTDYDSKTDTFYVADPANSISAGRIPLLKSSIVGTTQSDKIANLTSYWYVVSPTVKLNGSTYTVDSTSNGGGTNQGNQGSYNPDSDSAVFNENKTAVNKYAVVTNMSDDKTALRYYPSGSSSVSSYAAKGAVLYITYQGKNNFGALWYKTSGGYYIFSDNVTLFEKYSAEITKFNNTSSDVKNTYKITSSTDTDAPLRIEPSEGNNIIANAANGTKLYITKKGVNSVGALWYQTSEGYYIKASEMTYVSSGKASDAGYKGNISTVTGSYSSTPVADVGAGEILDVPAKYVITASALNLRKSAVDGDVLTVVPKDAQVLVTALLSGWGKITYNGYTGWISLSYAKPYEEESVPVTALDIDKITLNSKDFEIGEEVKCLVAVYGGVSPYTYAYSVYNDSGKAVYTSKSVTANTCTFSSETAGTYYWKIDVKDSKGAAITGYSGNFRVHDKLQINSVTSDADDYKYAYDKIIWTVDIANKSADTVCEYMLYRDGKLVEDKDNVSETVYEYTPEKEGTYILKVKLHDSVFSSDTVECTPVVVYNNLSIDDIRLVNTVVAFSEKIGCSVSVSGGTGDYSYCFSIFKNGSLIRNGSYGKTSEYEYTPDAEGTYIIFCSVKDSGNRIVSASSAEVVVVKNKLGDVDGDGNISAIDARLAIRYTAHLTELTPVQMLAADVNGDNTVSAYDARLILRCAAKLDKI